MYKLVVHVMDGTWDVTIDAANIIFFLLSAKEKEEKPHKMDGMDESIRAILPPRRR